MRIIIALDIIDGKCVRLTRGNFSTSRIYSEDPLKTAREIEDSGIKYLHLVDLDGAKNRKITNLRVLQEISSKTSLTIDFGGGIRSEQDLLDAFSAGAVQVTAGTAAVADPELFCGWIEKYSNEKLILGADFRNGTIVTSAWKENSDNSLQSFLSAYSIRGVKYAICTDVEKDGMLNGPATAIYRKITASVNINIVASGGISSLSDIEELKAAGCEGAIIGKAVYEGRLKLNELSAIC